MPQIEVTEEVLEKIKDQSWYTETDVTMLDISSLEDLVGESYAFQCARYIYHGKVQNITATHIVLKDAAVVYDTGVLDAKEASDRQVLPFKTVNIMRQAIESFWKPRW